jgi:predicted nucleotidyltransferase
VARTTTRSPARANRIQRPRAGDQAADRAPGDGSNSASSGRFLLRLGPGLHAALREAARSERVSLNEYCARKLAAPTGSLGALADSVAAVRRAAACFGADLVAVVAFGSWARGEASDASDVDLLIVVGERVELVRELYRRWDREGTSSGGRPIDIHIAHLPDPDRFSPSVWGEVAIDGVVLFERGLLLSPRLAQVRRRIAAGQIVRRTASGGQTYWVDHGADGDRAATRARE